MKTFKIENTELQIKRFYLPVQFDVKCPDCGESSVVDLESVDIVSYPVTSVYEDYWWYCGDCGNEHKYKIKINMDVEVDCEHTTE